MNNIKKISGHLLFIFDLLIFTLPLFIFLQWIFINSNVMSFGGIFEKTIKTPEQYTQLSSIHWTIPLKLLGFSADLLKLLPFLLSLFVLKRILENYKIGEIFNIQNTLHYRKLGILLFIDGLFIHSLSNMLLILAATLGNAPGHRYISISFGTPNLESLFFGTLIIILSWIMAEGSKIQDEQKFTI